MTIPRNLGDLANNVDSGGTLGVAGGGTGAATLTGVLKGNGTSAVTAGNVNLATEVTGTLPVANGGTGAATLTANNVLLGNGTSALQAVAPGASGNLLVSNGTTWTSVAPSGGGDFVLISTQTITLSTASVTWTGLTGYKKYVVKVSNAKPTTTDVLGFQLGTGATPTYTTSAYYNLGWFVNDGSFDRYNGQASESYIRVGLNTNPGSGGNGAISELIINGCDTTVPQYVMQSGFIGGGGSFALELVAGQVTTPSAVTAIKAFFVSGNNISSGVFSLYGIAS